MTEKTKEPVIIKREIQNLPTKITDEERQNYQGELLSALERIDEIESRKALEMERFKGLLKEADGKASQTRTILRSGEHYRDINCVSVFNDKDLTEEVFRTDTGERISVRALTSGEITRYSQQSLLPEDDASDPADNISAQLERPSAEELAKVESAKDDKPQDAPPTKGIPSKPTQPKKPATAKKPAPKKTQPKK